jgi:hemolysin activation/secretion protein
MNRLAMALCLLLAQAVVLPALADDVAAERSRLANQRIQAEEERRAREEAEREQQAQLQAESSPQPAATSSEPATRRSEETVSESPIDRIEMSRVLEQLRELGALKDAGYLTDEEFAILKKKILDGAL